MKTVDHYLQEIGYLGVTAIAAGSIILYKRFLSDAARKCNNLYGAQKSICMLNYKIQASQAMFKAAKTNEDKMMWDARNKKYQYQLRVAQRKLQLQQRTKK